MEGRVVTEEQAIPLSINATDQDRDSKFAFELVDDRIRVTPSLEITSVGAAALYHQALDHEAGPYSVDLLVHSGSKDMMQRFLQWKADPNLAEPHQPHTASATIRVRVSDVNEPPVVGASSAYELDEHAPAGTILHAPAATTIADPDQRDQRRLMLSLEKINAPYADCFEPSLAQDGSELILTVSENAGHSCVDFEAHPTQRYLLTVNDTGWDDQGVLSASAAIVVLLRDRNDAPSAHPSCRPSLNLSVPFAIPGGTEIVALRDCVVDPDTGDTHTYTLVESGSYSLFALSVSGMLSMGASGFDHHTSEQDLEFALRVNITDGKSEAIVISILITRTVGELPPAFGATDLEFSVDENLPR